MKNLVILIALLIGTTIAYGGHCARIIERGYIDCFEEGLKYDNGKTVWASPSAIVYTGKELVVASDKPIPGENRSAVFSIKYRPGDCIAKAPVTFYDASLYKDTQKYESIALGPCGNTLYFSTPYGTLGSDTQVDLPYNRILAADKDCLNCPRSVGEGKHEGFAANLGWLRVQLQQLFKTEKFPNRVNYVSVEGMTFGPGNRIYFGIRQYGQDYDMHTCTIAIASIPYVMDGDYLKFIGDLKMEYWIDSSSLGLVEGGIGLADLHYNKKEALFYLLTTYEKSDNGQDEDVGAHLSTLSFQAMKQGYLPTIIKTPDGSPLHFAHKMEGMCWVNDDTLVFIADDDYITGRERQENVQNSEHQFCRKPHQAAYAVVKVY